MRSTTYHITIVQKYKVTSFDWLKIFSYRIWGSNSSFDYSTFEPHNKNCTLRRDSNSDHLSRRRACWPLDPHHHNEKFWFKDVFKLDHFNNICWSLSIKTCQNILKNIALTKVYNILVHTDSLKHIHIKISHFGKFVNVWRRSYPWSSLVEWYEGCISPSGSFMTTL